ncbi:hypothetical protein NE237_017051 [Protea cynaroides]|uniref:UBC core domain-containing protein n=1 Tax=Protea cynaroides TaxID=273540 RepID=A0A9Q0QMD6_9MAGN|nr:hypothetical protein NE237_017051 [Protea cynaroides]
MGPSVISETKEEITEIKEETKEFKQFDIVNGNNGDHRYSGKKGHSFVNDTGTVRKKIMREWKILEENLPESIYVRVYEERIDLLRATIIGAAGTPYHDGLFFFDILFPPDYPAQPPSVHFHSHGLSINPNLYANGTVCLSLLNTWPGKKKERWNSSESTILQVLLSIQALVLNEKPYFNEPGNGFLPGIDWNKRSLTYNENIFLLSCKMMLYKLRNPPRHFEDFVAAHFRERAPVILMASKAYMDGFAEIGCLVGNGSLSSSSVTATKLKEFKTAMGRLYQIGCLVSNDSLSSSSVTATKSEEFKMAMGRLYPELVKAFVRTRASVGNFVEQVMRDEEETPSRPETITNKKKDSLGASSSSSFSTNSLLRPVVVSFCGGLKLDIGAKSSISEPLRSEALFGFLRSKARHRGFIDYSSLLHPQASTSSQAKREYFSVRWETLIRG